MVSPQAVGGQIELRLKGIAAPKAGQPFSEASKNNLIKLCLNKTAQMITNSGIGFLECGKIDFPTYTHYEINANKQQIKDGMAWAIKTPVWIEKSNYKGYYKKVKIYEKEEKEARKNKLGLWKDKNPIPPWKWEKKQK